MLSKLCRNKNYVCIATIFVIFWGIQSTVAVILTPLFEPGGYTTSELSLIGVCFVSGGMISLFIWGIILDRTKAYLTSARILCIGTTIGACTGVYIIPAGHIIITCLWGFLVGSFVLAIFTVALPYTVVLIHPIPSDAGVGIMMTGSYIFATIGCLGGAWLFEN